MARLPFGIDGDGDPIPPPPAAPAPPPSMSQLPCSPSQPVCAPRAKFLDHAWRCYGARLMLSDTDVRFLGPAAVAVLGGGGKREEEGPAGPHSRGGGCCLGWKHASIGYSLGVLPAWEAVQPLIGRGVFGPICCVIDDSRSFWHGSHVLQHCSLIVYRC